MNDTIMSIPLHLLSNLTLPIPFVNVLTLEIDTFGPDTQ